MLLIVKSYHTQKSVVREKEAERRVDKVNNTISEPWQKEGPYIIPIGIMKWMWTSDTSGLTTTLCVSLAPKTEASFFIFNVAKMCNYQKLSWPRHFLSLESVVYCLRFLHNPYSTSNQLIENSTTQLKANQPEGECWDREWQTSASSVSDPMHFASPFFSSSILSCAVFVAMLLSRSQARVLVLDTMYRDSLKGGQ